MAKRYSVEDSHLLSFASLSWRTRLWVDMPSRIGRRYVIPALSSFLEKHPDLHIEVSTTDRRVDLISEGVDCLIRVGNLKSSDIICRKLGDVQFITCASPQYLARFGTPKGPADLAHHIKVNYGPSLPAEPASFDYRDLGSDVQVPMKSAIAVNNAEAYIAAARAGLGLIQIPAFDVRDLLKTGDLVSVLNRLRPPSMQLSLLYARRRNVPSRILVFQDWISTLLRDAGAFE